MTDGFQVLRAVDVQASPVVLEKALTLDKIDSLVADAAEHGASYYRPDVFRFGPAG